MFLKCVIEITNTRNKKKGFRSLKELTKHLTTRTVRQPCNTCKKRFNIKTLFYYSKLGKICVYFRIKQHVPPLVSVPVYPFEFLSCENTFQAEC